MFELPKLAILNEIAKKPIKKERNILKPATSRLWVIILNIQNIETIR